MGDAGTLTFSGLHDPIDATGQVLLDSYCLNSDVLGSQLKFYTDNTSYWRVDTAGDILITKCQSITLEKSAMGTVDFEGAISGGAMIYI